MQIASVEAVPLAARIEGEAVAPISLPHAGELAHTVFGEYRTVLVKVVTKDGVEGWGECMSRLAPLATAAIVDYLAPVVVGRDARDIGVIWDLLYGTMMNRGHQRGFFVEAISGIDIALWDVLGKSTGEPVHRLLGGAHRDRLPAYASSLRFRPMPDTKAKIDELLASGLTAMKLKIGRDAHDPCADLSFVSEVRDYVGGDIRLMVDANCGYDLGTATVVARELERLGIYWFEEPLPPGEMDDYRRLADRTSVRIAAGEAEFTRWGFRKLLQHGGISVVQPNATRSGGVSECMKIAALASAHGVPYAPHTGSSSAVCMAVGIQLAAALPNLLIYEYMVSDWSASQPNPLRHRLLQEDVEVLDNGTVLVPQRPGFGIAIDTDIVDRYRIG